MRLAVLQGNLTIAPFPNGRRRSDFLRLFATQPANNPSLKLQKQPKTSLSQNAFARLLLLKTKNIIDPKKKIGKKVIIFSRKLDSARTVATQSLPDF
jgi:hypothetical protein